jgi:hypothetical protein
VALPVTARDDLEWGLKTAALVVEVGGRETLFWRPVTVLAEPKWEARASGWTGGKVSVSLRDVVDPWASSARPERVEVWAGGKRIKAEVGGPGTWPPTVFASAAREAFAAADRRGEVELRYTILGAPRNVRVSFDLPAATPDQVAGPADAIAAFVLDQPTRPCQPVLLALPKDLAGKAEGPLVVRDADGREAPAGAGAVGAGALRQVYASLPSGGVGPFFLCRTAAPPASDLRVAREADGGIRVTNAELTAVFNPARGGTVTELRWRGGPNVAKNSFGASWGKWCKFDPLTPAMTADRYLAQERKAYQWEQPARVEVAVESPACVRIQVSQKRRQVEVMQHYMFYPGVPFFRVASSVRPGAGFDAEEVAVLDVPLQKGSWDKLFPNFTGAPTGEDKVISGGWRQGPYVPPVATVMNSVNWSRSLSLVGIGYDGGRGWYRHGFYPERRGSLGVVNTARIEIVGKAPFDTPGGMAAVTAVLLHDGYQWAAEQAAPLCRPATGRLIALKGTAGTSALGRAGWWNAAWGFRAKAGPLPTGPAALALPLKVGDGYLDPASVRLVWQGAQGPTVLWCLAVATPANRLVVTTAPPDQPLGRGELYVYAQTTAVPPVAAREPEGVSDPSFERGGEGWSLVGAAADERQAHTGRRSVRLYTDLADGNSLAQTGSAAPQPKSTYRVSLWARTDGPGRLLNINFYADAPYDFLHVGAELIGDGQWHRYDIETPTGDFPPTVRPDLRIWVYRHAGPVWIDDVEVRPVREMPSELPLLSVEAL